MAFVGTFRASLIRSWNYYLGTEMTFVEMGLSEPILRAVTAEGYVNPTPIQAAAIPAAMAGRDLLGCAQTGTGKTAAFSLPVLHRLVENPPLAPASNKNGRGAFKRIRCLILSPTRELAIQIGDSLRAYGCHTGLRHTVVVGGVGQNPQVHALQRGVDILVATPGRLEDLRQQGYIDLRAVEIFVLDEADRMLDMGFMPSIRQIVKLLPEQKQTLFFSATMPAEIAELAEGILHNPERIRIAPVKQTTELVSHSVYHVLKQQKARLLATLLTNQPITRAIVFCRTKHGADRLSLQLEKVGIASLALHGDKSQSARQRALAHFKSNHPPVLVATDVAARGIDVDAVSHVFNFDLPNESETYVHRIGRTGRAGATGLAISFCDDSERGYLKAIERLIRLPIPVVPVGKMDEFQASQFSLPQGSGDDRRNDRRPASGGDRRDNGPPRGGSSGQGSGGQSSGGQGGGYRDNRGTRDNRSGDTRGQQSRSYSAPASAGRPSGPRPSGPANSGQRDDQRPAQDAQPAANDRPRKRPRYSSSGGR